MKKSLIVLALLASAGLASAQVANSGRISVQTATYAASGPNGSSASHAEVQAAANASTQAVYVPATTTGYVASNIGGGVTAVAYNTAINGGSGSASAGGWSDATSVVNGANGVPGQSSQGNLTLDGGMIDPLRNGTDAPVVAGTSQDGFATGTYSAAGTLVGSPLGVSGTTTQDSAASAGAVTFQGGVPAGQTAAVRYANSGVVTSVTGSFVNTAVVPVVGN